MKQEKATQERIQQKEQVVFYDSKLKCNALRKLETVSPGCFDSASEELFVDSC